MTTSGKAENYSIRKVQNGWILSIHRVHRAEEPIEWIFTDPFTLTEHIRMEIESWQ